MARSRVDLPEPLEPIRPIASPRYAVKRDALDRVHPADAPGGAAGLALTMRLSAAVALPLPPPPALTV